MAPLASIIVPTRERAGYLDVALASIVPQATAAGAEVLVVDDGPSAATATVARRHGARYVATGRSRGLNAARNAGIAAALGELLVFVDDDVAVHPGWLAALIDADARAAPDVGVLTGPIHARFEDHRLRSCGREQPPITTQELGAVDRDVEHAWGANMTIRRCALDRVGRFDESPQIDGGGDEQEWQERLLASGARIRYVAAAALDHRRAGDDSRLRSLAAAAYARGRQARRFDAFNGRAPALARELRVFAGCIVHGPRYRCANGVVMSAHSLGRLRAALGDRGAATGQRAEPAGDGAATGQRAEAIRGGAAARVRAALGFATRAGGEDPDFLSGESGTVRGLRRPAARAIDALLDVEAARRNRRLDRAGRTRPPRLRVLVLGIERPGRLMRDARVELHRTRHEIAMHTVAMGDAGKFEHLDALLAAHPPAGFDWVLVVDDDVVLGRGFLDRFLHCAEGAELELAQPAHRRHSHAAWTVTRRHGGGAVRESRFVEIGPVTAFAATTFDTLLAFPALRMGWGLDAHWSALAAEHGWRMGIVDATPILHATPVGGGYARAEAVAEAQAFLTGRPYVTRDAASWSRRLR